MILFIWTMIGVVVLVAALLIYFEHEWGFLLGGSTAAILVVSYFAGELLIVLLPRDVKSTFDAMAITGGALLVLAIIAIAYFAGRHSAAKKR